MMISQYIILSLGITILWFVQGSYGDSDTEWDNYCEYHKKLGLVGNVITFILIFALWPLFALCTFFDVKQTLIEEEVANDKDISNPV